MKKLMIILVGIIILGAITYLVIPTNSTTKITIYMFNNDLDSNKINVVIKDLTEITFKSSEDVSVILMLPKGKPYEFTIKAPSDFQTEIDFKSQTKDSISKYFINSVDLNEIDANIHIESFLNSVINSNSNSEELYFLIGSFPDCYKKEHLDSLSPIIESKLQDFKRDNITIYWNLESNQSEPEQGILKSLREKGLKVIETNMNVPNRECKDSYQFNPTKDYLKVDLAVFSPLDSARKSVLEKKIISEISDFRKVSLSLYNSQTSLVLEYEVKNYQEMLNKISSLIESSQKCDWLKTKYIIKSVIEKNAIVKDTTVSFLIGDVEYKEELVYRIDKVQPSKKYKIYIDLNPKKFESIITDSFLDKIEYESIK